MTEQKFSEIVAEDENLTKVFRWFRNGFGITFVVAIVLLVSFFFVSEEVDELPRMMILIVGFILSMCLAAFSWVLHLALNPWNPVRIRSSWYEQSILGDGCGVNTHCEHCEPNGDCDICGTMDGRDMECVNEYASTCDGPCAELTHHDYLTMDTKTQLGYCDDCIPGLSQEIKDRLE